MGTKVVSADEARKNFAELLNSATYGNERIQIERRGKVAGYIIGPKDMALLESAGEVSSSGGTGSGGAGASVRPEAAASELAVREEAISMEEESVSRDELSEEL